MPPPAADPFGFRVSTVLDHGVDSILNLYGANVSVRKQEALVRGYGVSMSSVDRTQPMAFQATVPVEGSRA